MTSIYKEEPLPKKVTQAVEEELVITQEYLTEEQKEEQADEFNESALFQHLLNVAEDFEFDEDFFRNIVLYEIKTGIPIGQLQPVYAKSAVPGIRYVAPNGKEYSIPLDKKNYLFQKSEAEESFSEDIETEYNVTKGGTTSIGDFFYKMEIFLRKYGYQQKQVDRENNDANVNLSYFQTKADNEDVPSIVALNFFRF